MSDKGDFNENHPFHKHIDDNGESFRKFSKMIFDLAKLTNSTTQYNMRDVIPTWNGFITQRNYDDFMNTLESEKILAREAADRNTQNVLGQIPPQVGGGAGFGGAPFPGQGLGIQQAVGEGLGQSQQPVGGGGGSNLNSTKDIVDAAIYAYKKRDEETAGLQNNQKRNWNSKNNNGRYNSMDGSHSIVHSPALPESKFVPLEEESGPPVLPPRIALKVETEDFQENVGRWRCPFCENKLSAFSADLRYCKNVNCNAQYRLIRVLMGERWSVERRSRLDNFPFV